LKLFFWDDIEEIARKNQEKILDGQRIIKNLANRMEKLENGLK
jgi:predicted DNA-binding ribbon-helix-helix protein